MSLSRSVEDVGATATLEGQLRRVLLAWGGYPDVRRLMRELPEMDIYLAGGAIRDRLLGIDRPAKDIDLFIGDRGAERFLHKLEQLGSLSRGPFGSPRWHPGKDPACYADVIPIASFYNGLWRCEDMSDVLNQFDFTGNAIAMDLRTGRLLDPVNGLRDLARRQMRAVRFDYPDEPINADCTLTRPAVVWLRMLHYAAACNLTIEPVTRAWLDAHVPYSRHAAEFESLFFPLHSHALGLIG